MLSFHAGYRCRHSGACCESNWPIPVEADRVSWLHGALADGRLTAAGVPLETPVEADADAPALLGRVGGRCVFRVISPSGSSDGHCAVHRVLGHDALPLACRQFPRVTVVDPRGANVTLSHYCPTAAALLEADPNAPATIAIDPPGFPAGGEYVGLDARDALPPLLRRDVLMDWDSWWECERRAVDLLANGDGPTAPRLARLKTIVGDIEAWTPADGSLFVRVRHAFDAAHGPGRLPDVGEASALVDEALRTLPAGLRHVPRADAVPTSDVAMGRFLAAHAFANWAVHLAGGDLRTWLRSIATAAAFLEAGAGVRQTDLILRHLADPGLAVPAIQRP